MRAAFLTLGLTLCQGGAFDGAVRSVELAARVGTNVQHYRLDWESKRSAAPLGVARFLSAALPAGGTYVELQLHYFADDVRVFHVEQSTASNKSLVFREVHPRAGRTLFLESSGALCQGYELGSGEVLRHSFALEGEFPLLVIDALRRGLVCAPEVALLDPLASRFEPTRIELSGAGELVTCDARRGDGSLRWRLGFAGRELREWRFQERGPLARAIPNEEFERLEQHFELDSRAAREAASKATRAPTATGRRLRTLVAPFPPAEGRR